MVSSRILFAAALLPLALAGCGSGDDISRTFGLTRDSPDEFQVTTRAPLSMPPDYTLRPPRPGAARPQEMSPRQAAEAALAPQSALSGSQAGEASAGQSALLSAAGPAAPEDIRHRVDADAALEQSDRSFGDKVMFWKTPEDKSVVLDPQREAQRLRENAALGQNPTTGDTPIIQRQQKSFWQSIF
jgi:hypothetical protein